MKITPRNGKAAFTLIEVMAVITIIVILAGLVVGGMGFVSERQAKEKAKVQIALLSKALEEYKLDMGKYPGSADSTPATGLITAELYDRLFYQGYEYGENPARTDTPADPKATKIYLADLDPTSTKQGWVTPSKTAGAKPTAGQVINDPWGKPYHYRKGTNAMNPDFDLWSVGKDGKTKTTLNAADLQHADMRDDIKNF
jgi:prepilin-type N-terminal cleavage/methylation domain-containing protein